MENIESNKVVTHGLPNIESLKEEFYKILNSYSEGELIEVYFDVKVNLARPSHKIKKLIRLKNKILTSDQDWIYNALFGKYKDRKRRLSTPQNKLLLQVFLIDSLLKVRKEKPTQMGMHLARNILGDRKQLDSFSEYRPQQFGEKHGIDIKREITRYGIDLTATQLQTMEGIIKGFTETDYGGNLEPRDVSKAIEEKYPHNAPGIYRNIREIPRIKASQADILEWAGIDRNHRASKERALEAIKVLGTKQFCFFYTRLVYDSRGNPIKDRGGDYKKEEVEAVDTLLTIKKVVDKKSKRFKYYEIEPSPILLDQINNYYLLIPYNWREEVRALVGDKKASSYTYMFLIFLMWQFEEKRRKHQTFIIKLSPEEICIRINMPESVYKLKKKRANEILNNVYSTAKTLGYLTDYTRAEVDTLALNKEKFLPHKKLQA